jgi:predicted lipoprotein with Yx(FWY)xxD motif
MTRSRSIAFVASGAALVLVAVAVAGCGGGGSSSASSAPPATSSGHQATVNIANTGLGNILVNSQGRTLYLFGKDSGTTSACTGACAVNWPPLRANGKPTLGSGANASLVGTIMRSDGKPQVTYNGHPLYLFKGDQQPGQTNGEGLTAFGGTWNALSASGNQVTGQTSNSGGGGLGY